MCLIYYILVALVFNFYYYLNDIDLFIANKYLFLYYIVLILESFSAIDGNVINGIFVNIMIIIGKILYVRLYNINTTNDYYGYVNTFFLMRILMKLKLNFYYAGI